VRIREYRPEDFNELWLLDQTCFPPGISYSRFELMHYIRGRGAFTLVAEGDDAKIGGFIVAECRRGVRGSKSQSQFATGHIITIDVAEWARRSGVGTLLMDEAELRMCNENCDVTYLEAAVDNVAAIAFYKGRGYGVLNSIPHYYNDEIDALVMGKRLVNVERAGSHR
jgi:ribosomal-protein-alanine N-acetyltransferase